MRLILWKKNTRKQTDLTEAALTTVLDIYEESRNTLQGKTQAILETLNEKEGLHGDPTP
ncbi:hypothetical protein [Streptomyces sp. NPDC056707]|uniref:hypothetical protein n=1 Tax=Streptomyces sp. NPDC056707 TaxID=3345919 RepID=UPI003687D862